MIGFFSFFRRVALIHDRVRPEQIRILGEISESCRLHRDLLFVDQCLIQTAAFTAR